MVKINNLNRDHHEYAIRCSRCGKCFWSVTEMLGILPVLCGECKIYMPIRFKNPCPCLAENKQCYIVDK